MAASYLSLDARPFVYFHAMHSVVDWFAYAIWEKGILKRSLSLSPDFGIMEDIGERQPFEHPYWSGLYPVDHTWDDDTEYPFPFHPLDLGEATLLELLGCEIEGSINSWQIDPGHFPLVAFKQKKRQKRF
jgi:hypothetical protein